jgi:hypothetical protein
MAAMLEKNDANGKPIADAGLSANEVVDCPVSLCSISYTLAYGQTENRMEESKRPCPYPPHCAGKSSVQSSSSARGRFLRLGRH